MLLGLMKPKIFSIPFLHHFQSLITVSRCHLPTSRVTFSSYCVPNLVFLSQHHLGFFLPIFLYPMAFRINAPNTILKKGTKKSPSEFLIRKASGLLLIWGALTTSQYQIFRTLTFQGWLSQKLWLMRVGRRSRHRDGLKTKRGLPWKPREQMFLRRGGINNIKSFREFQ